MLSLRRSEELFNEVSKIVPGGVHSGIRYREPFPIYFSRAYRAKIWDIDGNEYVDCVTNMGACILGHNYKKVVDAVKAQIEYGLTCGIDTELSFKVSKMINELVPCAEMVKFSNSGTEAVAHALQIVKGYTGKKKVLKMEGCYHGWYDQVFVSYNPKVKNDNYKPIPDTNGLADELVKNTIVVPYNNLDIVEKAVKENKDELAAVTVEPVAYNMGCVLPKKDYLKGLREITNKFSIPLIFDEVITGFRLAPGGAQEYYGIKPDIATFAKAIANGFPLSVVVGIKEIMKITNPKNGNVSYGGLYNGNQISLAAASVTLKELANGNVQIELDKKGRFLEKEFNLLAKDMRIYARMQSLAGKFQVYFTDKEVINYRDAIKSNQDLYLAFVNEVIKNRVLFLPKLLFHHGVCYAHSKDDLNKILSAIGKGLKRVKEMRL
jgi:glutamate-1-semialdehyde 2,1-aminomutase